MTSNFLGGQDEYERRSAIISANELVTREGVDLRKGMNFRDQKNIPQLSVFLVLPSHSGEYRDEWDESSQLYIYEGHDSTTVESGKVVDQLLVYESGRLSDNGKFYKAANAFKDGVRKEPLQIQVYEKLDPGVWYDKGIFNLVDARHINEGGRKVFKFHLTPADAAQDFSKDSYSKERMLPAEIKATAWAKGDGRCAVCRMESGLHFMVRDERIELRCNIHVRASI